MSLWEDGRNLFLASSPFLQPFPDPGTSPGNGPFVCVQFNHAWLPLVCGALAGLAQPQVWGMTGSADPTGILARVTELVNTFGLAGSCLNTEVGSVPITIAVGQASNTVHVAFATPYANPPVVVVASSDARLHAWFSNITDIGFDANLDADVPVVVDTNGVVNWSAFG